MDTYEIALCKHNFSICLQSHHSRKMGLSSVSCQLSHEQTYKQKPFQEKQITLTNWCILPSQDSTREKFFKERIITEISELKAMFPSCISKGFNTSMVWVSTSVKGHFCDSFLQTGLCNDFTHLLCHILMGKTCMDEHFCLENKYSKKKLT